MNFEAFDEISGIFQMMDWTLVSFAAPCLLAGPLPVAYWRRHDLPLGMGIGPITAEEVVMPLSPSRALVLTHPPVGTDPATVGDRDREVAGDKTNAAHLKRHHVALERPAAAEPRCRESPRTADGEGDRRRRAERAVLRA